MVHSLLSACGMHLLIYQLSALRTEWAKARQRAGRWKEQVRLLHEEMRRVIDATRHEASGWNLRRSQRQGQASLTEPVDAALDEGLKAYADEHAAMESALAQKFETKWAAVRVLAQQAISPSSADGASASHPHQQIIHLNLTDDAPDDELDDD